MPNTVPIVHRSPCPPISLHDEEEVEYLWDKLEGSGALRHWPPTRPRRTPSQDDGLAALPSDMDDYSVGPLATDDFVDSLTSRVDISSAPPRNGLRAPAGPNGRPLVDFPIPKGPDPEALLWDAEPEVLESELLRATREFMGGLKVARGVLRSMRHGDPDADVRAGLIGGIVGEEEDGSGGGGTVRLGIGVGL